MFGAQNRGNQWKGYLILPVLWRLSDSQLESHGLKFMVLCSDCITIVKPWIFRINSMSLWWVAAMPAQRLRWPVRARVLARCCLPMRSRRWARCHATRPSAALAKGISLRRLMPWAARWRLQRTRPGIQFRTLNASKGPAVRATRAQADRVLYRAAIRNQLENQPNLWLFQQAVDDFIIEHSACGPCVVGAITQVGLRFYSRSVVLTAGTFLAGKIHVGLQNFSAGRAGDPPANTLAARLRELNLPVGRLKTGTPPRIDGRSIDFSKCIEQAGDDPAPAFSFVGSQAMHPRQMSCWITHTTENTHDAIRAGLDRSPMFTGVIEGVGPRYCPSIEDKIHRFADKASHQIFLEPEGLSTNEYYPNGISTSLPFDVQWQLVRSIPGIGKCAYPASGICDRIRLLSIHAD